MISDQAAEKLEFLRSCLLRNSTDIVQLFRERSMLAREIGLIKEHLGLPARIREREEEILQNLGDTDYFGKAIISALFEYSIVEEERIRAMPGVGGHPPVSGSKVSGGADIIQYLVGLLVSGPGAQIYSDRVLPEPLVKGIRLNGGHIVHGNTTSEDFTVCVGKSGSECDIVITESNELLIHSVPVKSPSGTVVKIDMP